MYSQSLFEFGRRLYETHAEAITLSSVTRKLSCFSIEQLIEMNQKDFFFFTFCCTSLKRRHLPETESNFPSLAHRCLWSQTNKKQKVEDGLWNTGAFTGILPLLEGCPLFWKGFFSSKQTAVTLPILLPIKIYWKHPGNTVQLISSQLACQKQTNTAITTKKESFAGLLRS